MEMIEVFKTNITEQEEAAGMLTVLKQYFPHCKINFDLHDCDKILRVEGSDFMTEQLMHIVRENGFACSILE
jgi:tRNA G26 N,N-dimethylase Trm1